MFGVKIVKSGDLNERAELALQRIADGKERVSFRIGQTARPVKLHSPNDDYTVVAEGKKPILVTLEKKGKSFRLHSATGHHVSMPSNVKAGELADVLDRITRLGCPFGYYDEARLHSSKSTCPNVGDTFENLTRTSSGLKLNSSGVYLQNESGSIIKETDGRSSAKLQQSPKAKGLIDGVKSTPGKFLYRSVA